MAGRRFSADSCHPVGASSRFRHAGDARPRAEPSPPAAAATPAPNDDAMFRELIDWKRKQK